MQIVTFNKNIYDENAYLLISEDKHAMVIDPGLNGKDLIDYIDKNGLTLDKIVLTHGHGDHITDVELLTSKYASPLYAGEGDKNLLYNADVKVKNMFNLKREKITDFAFLSEKDEIIFANHTFHVMNTPGHTKGGLCIYDDKVIFTGDTLFKGSIGRTDLEGGDYNEIIESLKKISNLNPDLIVYSGHGESSTIGYEIMYNPFLKF